MYKNVFELMLVMAEVQRELLQIPSPRGEPFIVDMTLKNKKKLLCMSILDPKISGGKILRC